MLEYIVFGGVLVAVVLVILIYQNTKNKNNQDNEISLSNINERLGIIEAAQQSIENLNTNLIDFKNLFNDKTQRGKLGEEYLEEVVKDCLIEKHYSFQHTLSNGKRVDCILKFGSTNENICIDSKFSWENYQRFNEETNENNRKNLIKEFSKSVNPKDTKELSSIIQMASNNKTNGIISFGIPINTNTKFIQAPSLSSIIDNPVKGFIFFSVGSCRLYVGTWLSFVSVVCFRGVFLG